MIDLHIHTAYSDGTWTIKETLEKAQKANIKALSITDHNTVGAYYEIENFNAYYTGNVIKGVEINCIAKNSRIEILGYDFTDIDLINNWLHDNFSVQKDKLFRQGEYERLLEKLQKYGVKNNCNPIYENQEYLPHEAIYREIKKHESNRRFLTEAEWDNLYIFFRTATTNSKSIFYIDYTGLLPSIEEASAIVRKSNGKVFLAHVYQYAIDDHIAFIDELRNNHIIDGVEIYYVDFTLEQTKILNDYCIKHNLYMSGGSDCHGDRGKRKIGTGNGNLNVPENILIEWASLYVL
jgi:Predicted metal-dependent phosphoesterases (PHP family)